jgi:Flp pilus assembly CpaE family ATPase
MLAVNAAVAAAALDNTRTLLADIDLNCGLVQFALKLQNQHSIVDAARMANDLDENLWPQMVTSMGALDVIHSGTLESQNRLEPVQLRRFLDFARRNYRVICADLSGNLEDYATEVMRESKRIFLVTTPELPALHLARAKHRLLAGMDLADRVVLLLNRAGRHSLLTSDEIENVVGLPVAMEFPNDYKAAHEALSSGRTVDRSSTLGRQIAGFAGLLLDRKAHERPLPKKRFIEYFTLIPARYQLQR